MIARDPAGAETWLLSLPPTRQQTRWVIAIALCQVAALALFAPFAKVQLPQLNGFIPAFAGIIFVTDLITSVLLLSQFAIHRQRALLVLACGYLFSALMVIPYALTFPDAFSPTGLLGAGLQTTAWLYWFWHLSFPLALLGYGLMRGKKAEPGPAQASPLAVIVGSVALLLALACGLTLLTTAGHDYLPVFYLGRFSRVPGFWAPWPVPIILLVCVSALAVLWLRRRSLLDQWLMIVALAAILEIAFIYLSSARFSLGFYAGRLFSLLTATIVLVVLLVETMRLYANLHELNETLEQRVQAETRERLRKEAEIRHLVDANILGICIWNTDGAIVSANEEFLRMLQYSQDDVASGRLRWIDLTPPEWRKQAEDAVAELRSTGAFRPVEKEYFSKDGSRVPVLIGGALFEKDGNDGVAFVLDLTERKRAEEALRKSEYELRQIIDAVPGLIWSAGPDGEATYVSQRLLEYSGSQLQDHLKHHGWEVFVHPDDLAAFTKDYYQAIQTGTPYRGVLRLRCADGAFRWHDVLFEPLRDQQGRVIQWYGLSINVDEAKKAENQLLRDEAWLTQAQNLSHTGHWVYDAAAMRYVYWSDESYRIWGFDPQQGLPSRKAMWQRIHPDDRDRMLGVVRAAIGEKRDFTAEFRIVLPDGTVKHLVGTSHHLFSPLGALVEAMTTTVDVTERKRAEEELRESEQSLRSAIDGIPGFVGILAPNGDIETLNRQILEYTGQSLEELKNWQTNGTMHHEDLPHLAEVRTKAIAAGVPYQFEVRMRRHDGEYLWCDVRGVPVRDSGGRIARWYVLLTVIEDRKRVEAALRESEQSLRSAIDGIPGLVGVLAPNGDVEAVNRQIYEYCGQTLEELRNWGTNGTVHPEDLPHVAEIFGKSIAAGIPYQFEHRLRRFDGEYRWFDDRGVPIRDSSGRITRWYVLLTDTEDRTQALARLHQMQSDFAHINRVNTMGELAASLSHEILHPIATARNNARAGVRFLEMNPPNLDEVREALRCVVRDADRAKDIVGRVRDHIKKAPPRSETFDLNEAVREALVMVRSAIARSRITVNTHLMDTPIPVQGDRVQLQQVVVNLILNAVEAMGSNEKGARELSVRIEQDHVDGGVLVQVRDTGSGIDPDKVERVFEPFYTTKSSGVGMGLSICRSIISGHGGRLWAEANEPRGAVFQFTLPPAQEAS